MGLRLILQDELEEILGSRNVYFQPPESIKMVYPAIVYKLSDIQQRHADNLPYTYRRKYQLTLIDRSPESEHFESLRVLPYCSFDRQFVSENLNHYVFNLYF